MACLRELTVAACGGHLPSLESTALASQNQLQSLMLVLVYVPEDFFQNLARWCPTLKQLNVNAFPGPTHTTALDLKHLQPLKGLQKLILFTVDLISSTPDVTFPSLQSLYLGPGIDIRDLRAPGQSASLSWRGHGSPLSPLELK
jgi:hypothetical protein